MSQTKITIPITIEHLEKPGELVWAREFPAQNPDEEVYKFRPRANRELNGPFDSWELRDEFLAWPLEDWEVFVDMAGDLGGFGMSKKSFAEWQNLLREALIRPPKEWHKLSGQFSPQKVNRLFNFPRFRIVWDRDPPAALIATEETLQAIISTIQIDALKGAEFKVCAREDCKNPPFRVETRQKIYCSSDCAHVVAVRNSRARAAKDKTPRKRKPRSNVSQNRGAK